MIFYELKNTVTENSTITSFRNSNFSKVKNEMKNHADFYCSNGTGTIYKVEIIEDNNGNIEIVRTKVFQQ